MSDSETEQNEIVEAAAEAKAAKARAADAQSNTGGWPIGAIGLAVGIGSAAVAAAMLYAGRKKD